MISFIWRGLGAGALGGFAASLSLLLLGERSISDAIALENARSTGAKVEMFTRPTQVVGGVVALVLAGLLVGVIFAVAFVAARPQSRLLSEFHRSLWLAAIALGTIVLVPFAKYPANPPSVGDPDTITRRTLAYLSLLTLSIILGLAAWGWSRRLWARGWSDPARLGLVAVLYLSVVAVAYLVLPANPDAIAAPATLIWRFRLASLTSSACLWGVTGFAFGWLSERAEARQPARVEA